MSEMYKQYKKGWVEVICGCMFAGKTEELIRRIKVLEFAKQKIVAFKPKIDNRYSDTKIASHAGSMVESVIIESCKEILDYIDDTVQVVAIDEAQFFEEDLCEVCNYLADRGIRVMCAGLDMDFRGEPFGVMAKLITQAEFVTKLTAVCMKCGSPATRTQRLVNGSPAHYDDPLIQVGAAEAYEARCRHCHEVMGKPMIKKGNEYGSGNC